MYILLSYIYYHYIHRSTHHRPQTIRLCRLPVVDAPRVNFDPRVALLSWLRCKAESQGSRCRTEGPSPKTSQKCKDRVMSLESYSFENHGIVTTPVLFSWEVPFQLSSQLSQFPKDCNEVALK